MGTDYRFARAIARVADRILVTSDGELVDGVATDGESVVLFGPAGGVESPVKVAGGLPVKEAIGTDDDIEEGVRFRLCLDGAEYEPPYSGWLGRLLAIGVGSEMRLFAVPHDPKYSRYKRAFGCHLIYAHHPCLAPAQCRNIYGQDPCEAPLGFTCDGTYTTCKDRRNFAPCPHIFGEYPCLADPSGEPCQHSVATCRALGLGTDAAFGDSVYAGLGPCKNTSSSCGSPGSFLPFCPEFHVYCQPRPDVPFELSLHAAQSGRCVWLGQSQESIEQGGASSDRIYNISRVWAAMNESIRLRRADGAAMIPTVPSSAMLEEMSAAADASGVGVADISYSVGAAPVSGNCHHLASVQWVTSSAADERLPACVVVNSSVDGTTWSDDGQIVHRDVVDVSYDESAPTWPSRLERTEYRMPRVVPSGRGALRVYCLMGRVAYHTEVTSGGGHRSIYDEMWIRLTSDGDGCEFDPPIIMSGYIPAWPEQPDGFIRVAPDVPSGSFISTFSFRFGAAGWPTGIYEVIFKRGRYWVFLPVKLILGHREGTDGVEAVIVPVLMRYTSSDGVNFTGGAIVRDDASRYTTCAHSVPVCRSWTGATCSRKDGFCGLVGSDGRLVLLYPHCDGQGTGGAPGGSKWSRYEPGTYFKGPGRFARPGVRGAGPSFALAGCVQQGPFACRLKKAGYEGQWCARVNCPGFEPRGLWGSGGIKILDLHNDDI